MLISNSRTSMEIRLLNRMKKRMMKMKTDNNNNNNSMQGCRKIRKKRKIMKKQIAKKR